MLTVHVVQDERVRKLHEVGRVLASRFDGSVANVVRAARGSASSLVDIITECFTGMLLLLLLLCRGLEHADLTNVLYVNDSM